MLTLVWRSIGIPNGKTEDLKLTWGKYIPFIVTTMKEYETRNDKCTYD